MENTRRALKVTISSGVLTLSLLAPLPQASAATVLATGTDAAICNQEVSDNANVTAVRLAGGDCVITFKAGTVNWTAPSNLRNIRILIVGGGGGGGGSYDTAGAGGGGAGQVIALDNRPINPKNEFTISVGPGGAGGYHVARTNTLEAVGVSGGNSSISSNGEVLHTAFAGGGGGSSRVNGPGTSPRVGGAAATLTSGGIGGGPGGAWGSGGAGGGSAGAGGNGSLTDPGRITAATGGSGTTSDITGSSFTYGVGGAGGIEDGASSVNGTSAAANTGSGGGGAGVYGAYYRNGGAGGSGVVVIRYGTTLPIFSDLSISGNSKTATYRSPNTISATVNTPSLITFISGKVRIAGCISVATSGSASSHVATCTWKPNLKGAQEITAEATPIAKGLIGTSANTVRIAVVARSTRR